MKRLILAALALALGACTTTGGAVLDTALTTAAVSADAAGLQPPAPFTTTAIDEQGITIAWEGFRTVLEGINVLRSVGKITTAARLR